MSSMEPKRLCVAQMVESMQMGGAEHLAVQFSAGLAARGCESHLVVLTGPGPLSRRVDPGVQVHYLQYERASLFNPLAFGVSLRKGLRLLSDTVLGNSIDLVQTHLPGSNFWGLLLAMRNTCAVAATVHNNQEFRYSAEDSAFRVALRKWAYRAVVKRCDVTIAVSEQVRQSLMADLGGGDKLTRRIAVVQNGVPIPDLLAPEQVTEARQAWSVPAGAALLVAAGRFDEQKNFGDLITAASELVRTGREFRLVIAGEGPRREALERRISDEDLAGHVVLPGVVDDLPRLLGAADLLLVSSRWEGLPLVVLEAMAAGLPVVGYDIAGVRELVADGSTGWLVPPANPEGLAAAVQSALATPDDLTARSAAARLMVEEKYGLDRTVDDLLAQYRRCIPSANN